MAKELNKLFKEAENNTALLAEPVGMFKNLSPDDSFEKDVKQHMRTNTTSDAPKGKHCNVLSPRDVSPQAKVLASGQ